MRRIEYFECKHGDVAYDALLQSVLICQNAIADGANKHVLSVTVFEKSVVVVFDDPDLYEKSVRDSYADRRKGNVVCYSIENPPNILWRIDDLSAEPVHLPFCAGHAVMQEEQFSWSAWYGVNFNAEHEYYLALNYGGGKYLIDVTDSRLLKVVYSKD